MDVQEVYLKNELTDRSIFPDDDGYFSALTETVDDNYAEFIVVAAEEKIIVFCLPPNTTHRTQPLNKGAFSPLKICWREECHNFFSDNPNQPLQLWSQIQ